MGKVKIKASAIFELMAYRFVVNALTHCVTLFGNNFGKENIYKIILDYTISIGNTQKYGGVLYHLKCFKYQRKSEIRC